MNPQTVQTAILQTIGSAVSGLHTYDYSSPSPIPPAIDVILDTLTPDPTFDTASAHAVFQVRLIVGAVAEKGAQAALYGYITPGSSVLGAIHSHPTFGGAVASSRVLDIKVGVTQPADGGTRYWSATIPIEVFSTE